MRVCRLLHSPILTERVLFFKLGHHNRNPTRCSCSVLRFKLWFLKIFCAKCPSAEKGSVTERAYIYMYTCRQMHVFYTYIYTYTYTYINTYIYTYIYVCVYICMYICVYVYTYVYIYIYICIYIYTYICIFVYICIYMYMYM